ncbi:hypothetical protein EVAR_86798_1 [Eumeta japonica]|uniref:Uncharacterized protein n=1 Tax=Eumeta variegata TaxID=151549 RepID=A0A4C1VRV3_EUMVA|nr:hypothetical protein EVAR_86798_1 [Eumeta japonica]
MCSPTPIRLESYPTISIDSGCTFECISRCLRAASRSIAMTLWVLTYLEVSKHTSTCPRVKQLQQTDGQQSGLIEAPSSLEVSNLKSE